MGLDYTSHRNLLGDTNHRLGVLVIEVNQGSSVLVSNGGLKGAVRSW
jgi:hypothetical protein